MSNIMEAQGKRSAVSFDGNHVTLTHQAANGDARDQIRISVAHISAVRWTPAGAVLSGFIQFVVAGTATDGYAVSFNHSRQAAMEDLMHAVQETAALRASSGRLTT
jgi:hypothetical protein